MRRTDKQSMTIKELISQAEFHEKEGDAEEAVEFWKKVIKKNNTLTRGYDRLMIIYRKLGEYEKELETIHSAIAAFEAHNKKNQKGYNKKVTALSRSLLKATGLADKKGESIYKNSELARWEKRKVFVLKRLKSKPRKLTKVD